MADRVYCPEPPAEGRLTVVGDEARHLARVRRAEVGATVEVFDGRGAAYRAEVRAVGRDRVALEAVGGPLPDRPAPCRITLATAVPKGERLDWLVEKATELGVDRLVPLRTERSVVDPRASKLDRLQKLIIGACKQCGRNRLMILGPPVAFAEFLAAERASARLLAHPGGVPAPRTPYVGTGEAVTLAIGPEGGFSESEVGAARAAGWVLIDLGPTILRVETAGLVGCATILARVEG